MTTRLPRYFRRAARVREAQALAAAVQATFSRVKGGYMAEATALVHARTIRRRAVALGLSREFDREIAR